jgi:hypothetical protein
MVGAQPRTSCRSLFKQLEILADPRQYILSLMNFTVYNWKNFQTNSSIHSINRRNNHHHHRPNANLPFFKEHVLCWHKNFQQFTSSRYLLKPTLMRYIVYIKSHTHRHSDAFRLQLLLSSGSSVVLCFFPPRKLHEQMSKRVRINIIMWLNVQILVQKVGFGKECSWTWRTVYRTRRFITQSDNRKERQSKI